MYYTYLTHTQQTAHLHYTDSGSGNCILLLHGFCEDHTIWQAQIDMLQTEYRVVAVDLPGFGNSSPVLDVSLLDMATLVQHLLAHLHISQVVVLGHSMGGYVALAMAHLYPSMLQGIGLVHSHLFADTPDRQANRLKGIDFVLKNGTPLYVKQLIPSLFGSQFVQKHSKTVNDFIDRASVLLPESIATALDAMRTRPSYENLVRHLTIPFLVVIGDSDSTISPAIAWSQTHLANCTQVTFLRQVGHMGMMEAPQQLGSEIRTFAHFCTHYRTYAPSSL
jgi:pimeloyl-ACP methyl ester carboxylesterase